MSKTTKQHKQLNTQYWDWRYYSKAINQQPKKAQPTCNYPHCNCPFDLTPQMQCIKKRPKKTNNIKR